MPVISPCTARSRTSMPPSALPVLTERRLDGEGDLDQGAIAARPADELQPDWQAVAVAAARKGERRQTGQIERRRAAGHRGVDRQALAIDLDLVGLHRRGA